MIDKEAILARLLSCVEYEPNTGCWLHWGASTPDGHVGLYTPGWRTFAHRASWILHHGEPAAGMLVCHKCDTPACVNPDHLFLGTQSDNIRDCVSKGRHAAPKGERHLKAKLSDAQIPEIVRRIACGESQGEVARDLGLSQGAISAMLHCRTWRHVPRDVALTAKAIEASANWPLRPSRQRRPGRWKKSPNDACANVGVPAVAAKGREARR